MEDEDLIREHMEDTRTAMTAKLETLERKVVDTVEEATSAVTETVATVKDSIEDTVTSVTDSVQETVTAVKDSMEQGVDAVKGFLDVPAQVQRYPWPMVGGSLALGFLLGRLLRSQTPAPTPSAAHESSPRKPPRPLQASSHSTNGGHREKPAVPKAGILDGFGPELEKLKSLAVGALMGAVREMVVQAVPEHMGEKVQTILDSVTEKLGGEPVPAGEGLPDRFAGSPETANGNNRNAVGPGFRR